MDKTLRPRWWALCQMLCGAPPDAAAAGEVFDDLAVRMSEPHRAYHNLRHVAECLHELDGVRPITQRADLVEWALWFHDAVYDPRARDNEARSAELAQRQGARLNLPEAVLHEVGGLILATRHVDPPQTPDEALMVDIDLAILGQSAERFDAYERAIRREYDWVEDRAFAEGRASILRRFLARPHLYYTDSFRQRYEGIARANLQRSIDQLLR